jgi:hypothetical protein
MEEVWKTTRSMKRHTAIVSFKKVSSAKLHSSTILALIYSKYKSVFL